MLLASLPLTAPEITTLEAAAAQGPHPRMRRRAQVVLGHHRGATVHQLATLFAVGYNTVGIWLRRWQELGLAGLAEGQRSGRPPKLPPAVKKSSDLAGYGYPTSARVAS